ncbi:MAG: UDP-glucose/GDP-mannose dehydrogenase family protein [Candidatus Cloacimonas acidaminovorans]|nr:UDP-glucose/GDP-mannose dehydrogenase family protein [Candidatus Cloacimonas acidaminovorans]
MKIAVIGSGYVGLTTSACFAEMGNTVISVDKDENKIEMLQAGKVPIYEPGLEDMILRNMTAKRLNFTLDTKQAVQDSQIIFIAVGTPPGEDGSADLQYVIAAAEEIASYLNEPKIIVNKSTVPVGTADLVNEKIQEVLNARGVDINYAVVSNPEFLKEGSAIDDFMSPDRVVIGTDNPKAGEIMRTLYEPFCRTNDRILIIGIRSAEMSKYAANSFLATKISFINEISRLCDAYDADIAEVRNGMCSDSRIGYKFIFPGVGYGGSCFPKDIKALINMSRKVGYEPRILKAVEEVNSEQKKVLVEKVKAHFGKNLKGKTFAVWGLAFKPQTDDMREAPSVVIINELIAMGATVKAYDPVAMQEAKKLFGNNNSVTLCADEYETLKDAVAMLLITEWHQFRYPDFERMSKIMRQKVIFDGRNQYNPKAVKEMGFTYYGIGRR